MKSYLSDHPADYGGHFENLLEFIYWYYSECNCEENEAARKAYVEFWDKLCEACERIAREAGTAGADGADEEIGAAVNHVGKLVDLDKILDMLQSELNIMLGYQTESAYIEGMKLGARLMAELMG